MKRYSYTIWKGKEENGDGTLLLKDAGFFYTKHRAFKKAQKLAKQLAVGWDYIILVRRISLDSDMCLEWLFPTE